MNKKFLFKNATLTLTQQMDMFDSSKKTLATLRKETRKSYFGSSIHVSETTKFWLYEKGEIRNHHDLEYIIKFSDNYHYDKFDISSWFFVQIKKVHSGIKTIAFRTDLIEDIMKTDKIYYRLIAAKLASLAECIDPSTGLVIINDDNLKESLALFLQEDFSPSVSCEEFAIIHNISTETAIQWCEEKKINSFKEGNYRRIFLKDALAFKQIDLQIAA